MDWSMKEIKKSLTLSSFYDRIKKEVYDTKQGAEL